MQCRGSIIFKILRTSFKAWTHRKLQDELVALKSALRERDAEVVKLSRLREDLEAEMEDLTASLFEEAHKMVRDANVKQGRKRHSIDIYFVPQSVPSHVTGHEQMTSLLTQGGMGVSQFLTEGREVA